MSRRELLWMTILGASVILGGCGEMSKKEKREQARLQSSKQSREARRKLLKKVRNGYEGTPPSSGSRAKNRF